MLTAGVQGYAQQGGYQQNNYGNQVSRQRRVCFFCEHSPSQLSCTGLHSRLQPELWWRLPAAARRCAAAAAFGRPCDAHSLLTLPGQPAGYQGVRLCCQLAVPEALLLLDHLTAASSELCMLRAISSRLPTMGGQTTDLHQVSSCSNSEASALQLRREADCQAACRRLPAAGRRECPKLVCFAALRLRCFLTALVRHAVSRLPATAAAAYVRPAAEPGRHVTGGRLPCRLVRSCAAASLQAAWWLAH